MRDPTVCGVDFEPSDSDDPAVRRAYAAVRDPAGYVDNLYKAMSLSPGAIEPADRLYRELLHTDHCPFPNWLRELFSVQVAIVCHCEYAFLNHGRNFHDFYGDRAESDRLLDIVERESWDADIDDPKLRAMLSFGNTLARTPERIGDKDREKLRDAGVSDGEIVYLSQIGASFAYWCRIINALGISIGDEAVGLSKAVSFTD